MKEKDRASVFVGSEPYMHRAEVALEYSIRRFWPDVRIEWMDYSRGGLWAEWDIGREYGKPASNRGWFTDFSNFRMAAPQAAGFEGRALYLDVDMLALRDPAILFDSITDKPALMPFEKNGEPDPSVILFDCAAFRDVDWWPRIDGMKSNNWSVRRYVQLLREHDFIGRLDGAWYSVDGDDFGPETVILHYSYMGTQPWEPYAPMYQYPPHPRPDLTALWWKTYAQALEKRLEDQASPTSTAQTMQVV
jgi:hypothetical protein